jgi:hypothetical protein
MKFPTLSRKWKSISVIVAGMAGLSTLSFNCAPSLFQSATYSSSSRFSPFSLDNIQSKYSLLTAEQSYKTMLNVTDQDFTINGNQQNEYNARFNSLGSTNNLGNLTGSLLLGTTSLAGEICNGLVQKEKALTADARRFFKGINFAVTPANNTAQAFLSSVDVLAVSAWGRNINPEEQALFAQFFEDFKANLKTTNNAQQTDNLCISACSAVLSSFDALVY